MSYKIKLSENEHQNLIVQKSKCRDIKIYRRLICIEQLHNGKKRKEIADYFKVSLTTITNWVKLYLNKGFKGLCTLDYDGRRISKLDNIKEKIREEILTGKIETVKQLASILAQRHEVEVSVSWLHRYLKKRPISRARK